MSALESITPLQGFADASAELARFQAAHQDLLRAISHDLRAPLRHVTAFAPLLRELVDTPALAPAERAEALEFLGTMEHAGQRMGLMIDGLLALSRASAVPLRVEDVDLEKCVRQVVNELTRQTRLGSIDWQLGALPIIRADAALLHLALLALLSNAVKFSARADAPLIRVFAEHAESVFTLTVQDNGAGFDMAHSAGLFGLFQRLHHEREFEGVGAGMALVRAVAERHGGSVQARADVGQGCVVELRWPGNCGL